MPSRLEFPAFYGQVEHLRLQMWGSTMSKRNLLSKAKRAYQFIEAHRGEFSVALMCRMLGVARAGHYASLDQPISDRVRGCSAASSHSHVVHGQPWHLSCASNPARPSRSGRDLQQGTVFSGLMQENGLKALHGYRIRYLPVAKLPVLIPNRLQRQFTMTRPNEAWVTDITYIRTWQGWL